jgi:hypothetical protein
MRTTHARRTTDTSCEAAETTLTCTYAYPVFLRRLAALCSRAAPNVWDVQEEDEEDMPGVAVRDCFVIALGLRAARA